MGELFLHLAREPADRAVVKPARDGPLFRFFHSLHGSLLLAQVALVFDLSFHGLEFVSHFGRKRRRGFERNRTEFFSFSGKERRIQLPEDGRQPLNYDLWALQQLSTGLADCGTPVASQVSSAGRDSRFLVAALLG